MHPQLKAKLQIKLSEWLEENCDDIGGMYGIYQDDSQSEETALVLANSVDAAFMAMVHQVELVERLG